MDKNIQCLIAACSRKGILFNSSFHPSKNVVEVTIKGRSFLFLNWQTPLLTGSQNRLFKDKEYTYNYLSSKIRMPKQLACLAPNIATKYQKYLEIGSVEDIVRAAQKEFELPVITKRNSGSGGSQVFLCETWEEVKVALEKIFNKLSSEYDYVSLIQEYIAPIAEYRAIALDGSVRFAYLKDNSEGTKQSNLSPLHWEGAKAITCSAEVTAELQDFLQPILSKLPYAGLDIIKGVDYRYYLIEVNGSPSYVKYIDDNGPDRVTQLFEEMLEILTSRSL